MATSYNSIKFPKNKKSVLQTALPRLRQREGRDDQELERQVYANLLRRPTNYSNPLEILESAQRGGKEGGLVGGLGGLAQGVGQFAMSPLGKRLIALGIGENEPGIANFLLKTSDIEDTRAAQQEQERKGMAQDLYKFREIGREKEGALEVAGLKKQEIDKLKKEDKKRKYIQSEETNLRKEFNSLNVGFRKSRDSYNRILKVGHLGTAASDIALIFSYMKVLDPTSTILPSEYATAANAGGVPARAIAIYNKLLDGTRLAPSVRADFIKTSHKIYQAKKDSYDKRAGQFAKIAKREGLSLANIVNPEEDAPIPEEESPGPQQPQGKEVFN